LSKCLKCGAELPPVGECTACSAAASPPASAPSLLDKDIHIDRRRTPERTPAVPGPVPSFADLARSPATPPGMTPAVRPAAAFEAPRSITPPAFPQVAAPPPTPASAPPPAPPAQVPTTLATAAQLPQDLGQHAAPRPPAPGGLPRPGPTPVPVVTFAPPVRTPPPPPSTDFSGDTLPPRLPAPIAPPAGASAQAPAPQARSRSAPGVKNAALGTQEIHARPASLWRRLLSFTIDSAAIIGVSALYITLASSVAGVKAPSAQGLTALDALAGWINALKSVLLPGSILVLVLATVYCAVAAFLWNGRTLGRMALGLRLVDTHGLAPAPARAIVRALLSVVSFGLFLGGFWMALFDRRGQTLHDKLTSTFVVQPS
jgi:uncharacterized RDD family membrane protein YckC